MTSTDAYTPAPTSPTWDAHVSDIFTAPVLLTLSALVSLVAAVYYVLHKKHRSDLVDLFAGVIICLQDVTSDWILIVEWYMSGDVSWASWMLASVLLGGQISAEALRQRDEEERAENCQETSCPFILGSYLIDLIGFSVVRTFRREYELSELHGTEMKLDDGKREITALTNNLYDLSFCVHLGGVVESLISFTLVSYYIISGTVAYHKDVKKPSEITFLTWIFSCFGIIYKMLTFDHYETYIKTKYSAGNEWPKSLRISYSILSVWFMLLLCVLPAFIHAQFDNGVILDIFPEALSDSIAVSYLVPTFVLVSVWMRRFYWVDENKPVFLGVTVGNISFVLVNFGSIWLLITQLYVQFEGRFRTPLGETLCWYWTIGAIIKLTEVVVQLLLSAFWKKSDKTDAQQKENADILANDSDRLKIERIN